VLADQDGDGFLTWQEYWAGTDPTNENSYLKIDSLEISGGQIRLSWQHSKVDGSNIPPICIQFKTNLMDASWNYAGQLSPVDGTNSWQTPAVLNGFYRLSVTNAP